MRFRIAVAGALLFASGLVPVRSFGQPTDDNPSVTAQLDSVKPLLAKIKKDSIAPSSALPSLASSGLATTLSGRAH